MLIGLAGVTSTGKTTASLAIKERFGDRVNVLGKISRQEIYEHIGKPDLHPDLRKVPIEDRIAFDIGRVQLQMDKETEWSLSSKPLIVDGCALLKAAYLIYLSGQFMPQSELDVLVDKVLDYVESTYTSIFYLPVYRVPFEIADHRLFSSRYVRSAQDAILKYLLTLCFSRIKINWFPSQDMNLLFDELYKLGVE